MRIRRRTAAAIVAAFLLLSALGALRLALRPAYLRAKALEAIQVLLADGFEPGIGAVSYDSDLGAVVVTDLTLARLQPERVELVRIPRLEASTREWKLIERTVNSDFLGAITEIRLKDPEILVERDATGRFRLAEAFRPAAAGAGGGGPRDRPHLTVEGGRVRYSDPAAFAPGEEARLAIESIDWEASRGGGPSGLTGILRETGSPASGGAGALGRITVRGEFPLGRQGLRVLADRFEVSPFLLDRLAPALRAGPLSVFAADGFFGEGEAVPGLEVSLGEKADGVASLGVLLRPRGVDFLVHPFPLLFTDARGEAEWKDGTLTLHDLSVRRGAAEIHLDGRVENLGPDATGSVEFWARDLYLDHELRDALRPSVQRVWDAYALSGTVDITLAREGEPGTFDSRISRAAPGLPFTGTVSARLRDGEMSYRGYLNREGVRSGFDFPVTGVTGEVRVAFGGDGVTVDLRDIRGTHGAVGVEAHGTVKDVGARGADVSVIVEARDLPLDGDVRSASPSMERLFRRFAPEGTVAELRVQVDQKADLDDGAFESIFLDFDGRASFSYEERLPLRLQGVTGRVEHRKDRVGAAHVLTVALQGIRGRTLDGAPVSVDGTVEGEGDARLRVSVRGEGVPLDGALEEALRKAGIRGAIAVWDRARPAGPADIRAEITGTESAMIEHYAVDLRGATAQGWGDLRFPATGLEGRVEVSPEEVLLRGLRGTTPEGPFTLEGVVHAPAGDSVLDLRIHAEDFPLDESLRERLGPAAKSVEGFLSTVRPRPGFRGTVDVLLRGRPDALEPEVVAVDLRGGIAPLDLRNLDVSEGRARYAAGVVTVEGLHGSMADRDFTVESGTFDLERGTGALSLEVRRLRFPRDLLGVISEETAGALEGLARDRYFHVDGLRIGLAEDFRRVTLDGVLGLSPMRPEAPEGLGLEGIFTLRGVAFLRGAAEADPVRLTGSLDIEGGRLDAGVSIADLRGRLDLDGTLGAGQSLQAFLRGAEARVQDRSLRDGSADMVFDDSGFLLKDLAGKMAEGDLRGHFRSGPGKPAYEGKFTISGAKARELFSPGDPSSEIRGRVSATVEIVNGSGKPEDLGGKGRVDVVEGKLGQAPALASLPGVLRLKKAADFTSAVLEFDIHGDRLRVQTLDLDSADLGLHKAVGGSHIWLDGRLDVNLTPDFKSISGISPVDWLLNILGDVMKPIYERFHTVNIGGTLRQPVVTQKFFKGLLAADDDGKGPPHLPPPAPAVALPPRPVWDF